MIIIKEVPGLTPKETIEALADHHVPGDPTVVTANGGFAVGEELAYRFLRTYLIATGTIKTETPETPAPDVPVPPVAKGPTSRYPRKRPARKES